MIEVGKEGRIRCPVCDGSGRMSIVEFVGVEKKDVKVKCSACGGEKWIPFIDLNEEVQEGAGAASEVGAEEALSDIEDGWRESKDWGKVHYFVDGRSICGNIRSKRTIRRSTKAVDVVANDKCVFCDRKYEKLKDEGD